MERVCDYNGTITHIPPTQLYSCSLKTFIGNLHVFLLFLDKGKKFMLAVKTNHSFVIYTKTKTFRESTTFPYLYTIVMF